MARREVGILVRKRYTALSLKYSKKRFRTPMGTDILSSPTQGGFGKRNLVNFGPKDLRLQTRSSLEIFLGLYESPGLTLKGFQLNYPPALRRRASSLRIVSRRPAKFLRTAEKMLSNSVKSS